MLISRLKITSDFNRKTQTQIHCSTMYIIIIAYCYIYDLFFLIPPTFAASSEVIFGPWGEEDLAILGNIAMGKSKWKRSRSTNDGTVRGVLRSVAWAHELVLGGRPWDNTSQVSAHWKDTEKTRRECNVHVVDTSSERGKRTAYRAVMTMAYSFLSLEHKWQTYRHSDHTSRGFCLP